MPKISKKAKKELYNVIEKEIMDARIKINAILDTKTLEKVDEILFELNWKCPKKAMDYFETR